MFAYADGPTELLNYPAVSGIAITTPVKAKAVYRRGSIGDASGVCTALKKAALGLVEDSCVAILNGSETSGARSASIEISALKHTRQVPFRIHHLVADSITVDASLTQLKAIAGWYQDDCETLMYQRKSGYNTRIH